MKKIFTLIAAAAMALGANAQVISFGAEDVAAAGSLNGKTFGTGFTITITDGEGKFAIDALNAYFGTADEQVKYTHRLKTGGKSQTSSGKERWITANFPSAGTLKVSARSASSSETTRTFSVVQSGKTLISQVVKDEDAVSVEIEANVSETNPTGATKVYPVYNVKVAAGEAEIDFSAPVNFYAFEFVAGEDSGSETGGGSAAEASALIDYPTSDAGIVISGTTAFNNSQKYHANADTPKNISFKNGYTTEGVINDNWAELSTDGGFKAGDKVSVAGYFNNTDASKQAAVQLFVGEKGEAPTALWKSSLFINGRSEAADPTVETYTLEADYATLKLGRADGLTGATRTNVTLIKVERTVNGIATVLATKVENPNAPIYNLAGQQVTKAYKGVVIQNGKKFIQK